VKKGDLVRDAASRPVFVAWTIALPRGDATRPIPA